MKIGQYYDEVAATVIVTYFLTLLITVYVHL